MVGQRSSSAEIPTRAGPKSWKEGSAEFLVPRRSSCVSCGGGGAVERRVLGGAGCSAQQSKARRAELGFCGGCGGEDGSREAAGGLYKAAANLGVRARVWKAGVDSAGDSGRAVARGRRTC